LEILGMVLVLCEVYREDLVNQANGWLGTLPGRIQAVRPRDTPVWLPFWFVFGPLSAYFIYLPLNSETEARSAGWLAISFVLFGLSRRWRPHRWWQAQPLAFLLLAPFALPNMSLVYSSKLLIWCVRRILGTRVNRLARVGLVIGVIGFAMDIYQTTVVLAPPAQTAPCVYAGPEELGR
jgi:hypothetical protein